MLLLWIGTASGIMAEIKLKSTSIEMASPDSWTTLHVNLENREDTDVDVELSVVSGQLDSAISGARWPVTLPAQSRYAKELPLYIPAPKSSPSSKSSRPHKKNKHQVNTPQRSFQAEVQLLRNGAIIAKDSVMGSFSKTKMINGLVIRNPTSKAEKSKTPMDSWPSPNLSSAELKIMGENHRIKMKNWPSLSIQPLNASVLHGQSIVWMEELKSLNPSQFTTLQQWILGGGLLILDATRPEPHFLQQLWGYKPIHSRVGQLEFSNTKTSPLWGYAHDYDPSWSMLQDQNLIPFGAQKNMGLGRVIILEFPWADVVSNQPKLATSLMQSWLPESLDSIVEGGNGQNEALMTLKQRTGQKVWGKMTVIMFLGSLLICAMALSFVGPFRKQAEMRWGLWMGLVFLWTGTGLVIYLLNSDQSTRSSSMAYQLKSPNSPWAQEWGMASIISGEKRRFPLSFDDRSSWNVHQPTSWVALMNGMGLQWSDFSLMPQIEKNFVWKKSMTVPLQTQLKLNIGKHWSIFIPKSWNDFDGFLVMGRRYWKLSGAGEHRLELSSAQSMQTGKDMNSFPLSVFQADSSASSSDSFRAETSDFNLLHQVFLVRQKSATAPYWNLPQDVIQHNDTLEFWRLTPEVEPSSDLILPAGVEDWSFTRTGETRRSFRGFDGIHLPVPSTLDMTLGWPTWLKGHEASPKKLSLCFSESMNPMDWKVTYLQDGKDVNLTLKGQEVNVPIKAWQEQKLQLTIKSRMRASGVGTSGMGTSTTKVFPLLGLKWQGEIQ